MTTVLLVDDDVMTRRLMSRVFGREGYVPIEAGDGSEALAVLETLLPDLILLDLGMPRVDGLELLEHLRDRMSWRRVPVLVLSGTADSEAADRVRALGAIHFLHKASFSLHEMMQHVRRVTASPTN